MKMFDLPILTSSVLETRKCPRKQQNVLRNADWGVLKLYNNVPHLASGSATLNARSCKTNSESTLFRCGVGAPHTTF